MDKKTKTIKTILFLAIVGFLVVIILNEKMWYTQNCEQLISKEEIEYIPAPLEFVNVDGKRWVPDGFEPAEEPEEICGYFTEYSEFAENHGQTNMKSVLNQPYGFVDGILVVYSESWSYQDEVFVFYRDKGWKNFRPYFKDHGLPGKSG